MENTNKYWLYLEPYSFLFSNKHSFVIYNSLSFELFEFEITDELIPIINGLLDFNNLYCVPISNKAINNNSIKSFIGALKQKFAGDCISQSIFNNKPVILPPRVNIQYSVEYLKNNTELSLETNLCRYLTEISIYINGSCLQNCPNCSQLRNQFAFCNRNDNELDYSVLNNLLRDTLNHNNISVIRIIGGDIYLYSSFLALAVLLKTMRYRIIFYIQYLNSKSKLDDELLTQENFFINYLVNFPIDINKLSEIAINTRNYKHKIKWSFVITNLDEYEEVIEIINSLSLIDYIIYPYYSGQNYEFFKESVFVRKENIFEQKLKKEEIFSRQVLNLNDFGKLIVLENGNVFANINSNKIGTINDGLQQVVLNELNTNNNSWFHVRNNLKPCRNCNYNSLCPPLSNYELVFDRPNLCHITP